MVLMYDFGNGDYEFVPSREEVEEGLQELSKEELLEVLDSEEYKDCTKKEIVEAIMDSDLESSFEDELWEYFESVARDEYIDNVEYNRDMYGYYGLRESDFH